MKTDNQLRPSVTVCMATYNGVGRIEEQIQSILTQLEDKDELVISDDGSSDGTVEVIKKFRDKRIKIHYNKGMKGPTGNFQNALANSSGEVIFLSDQDDIWLPNKINNLCMYLVTADLVLGNCQVVDENDKVLYQSFFKYRQSKPGFIRNLYKNSYIGCCMAFKKGVLSYVLPFPQNIHMHDWWIGLMVELKGKVAFSEEITMKYIRHGLNASPTGEISNYSWGQRLTNRFNIISNIGIRMLNVLY